MGGRFEATTKSPLHGTVFTSSFSGRLGVHLKKFGIDNLERLFKDRERIEVDILPGRFGTVPLGEMLEEYYEIRGWDNEGKPKRETLQGLKLP